MTQPTFVRLVLLSISTVLLSGSLPQGPTGLQQEIDALVKRGFTVRWLDNDLVELTDPASDEKQLKSLREPSETAIQAWAAQRGVPILEIDPNTIDTSKYASWFKYWTSVPLGNGVGNALLVGDLNHNGQEDVYAVYLDTLSTDSQTRIYEVDSFGNALLTHQYAPMPGRSRQVTDAEGDSLTEVVYSTFGTVSGYEQVSVDSLPIYRTFAHDRYITIHLQVLLAST